MNYAMARQRSDKSGWAFTIQNDGDVWTAPCCRTEEQDADGYRAHKHATEDEAVACFNAWRRDPDGIKLNDQEFGDWTGCQAVTGIGGHDTEPGLRVARCDAPTKLAATHNDLGGRYRGIALCEKHMTVENVVKLIEDCSQVTYS